MIVCNICRNEIFYTEARVIQPAVSGLELHFHLRCYLENQRKAENSNPSVKDADAVSSRSSHLES